MHLWGSHLLADLVLPFYVEKWLADFPRECKPTLYRGHVDDCFLLFDSGTKVAPFLEYLTVNTLP